MQRKTKNKNRNKPFILLTILIFALAIFTNLGHFPFRFFYTPGQDAPETLDGIPLYADYLPDGSAARPGTKRRILYVTIHETDNPSASADAQAHNTYLHEIASSKKLSWHYTVDDHQIYHHIPDDEIAFNAGDGYTKDGGNMDGIGIEMCVNAGGDYEQTLKNTAKLTAYLLRTYDLSIDQVKKHQDFSGKHCPSRLLSAGRWPEFLEMVQKEL